MKRGHFARHFKVIHGIFMYSQIECKMVHYDKLTIYNKGCGGFRKILLLTNKQKGKLIEQK